MSEPSFRETWTDLPDTPPPAPSAAGPHVPLPPKSAGTAKLQGPPLYTDTPVPLPPVTNEQAAEFMAQSPGWHATMLRMLTNLRTITTPVEGTVWNVEHVAHVTDGDTVRLVRSRLTAFDGRHYLLMDADQDNGFPVRLTWLDTPERTDKTNWARAKADLVTWIVEVAVWPLSVTCYESGGWDRIMGDLRDANGNSASQWMMKERGWPPYVKGQ